MARTPLFAALRRTFRKTHAASQLGVPLDEALDQAVEARRVNLTRRSLLKAGGAMAGAAVAGACTPLAPRGADANVVVVGAGIAGLTTAYRLRQAGVRVQLIEAQTRLGGRMLSLRDHFADHQVVELGAELIDTGHQHMRALATELELVLDDFQQDDQGLAQEIWHFGGQNYSSRQAAEAFAPIAAVIRRDLAPLNANPADAQAEAALDRLSVAQWLDRAGARGWIRQALDVAYTTEMGREIGEQSALNLLWTISPDPDPFRVFGESDERFHTRGGNDLFISGLAARLGDSIATGSVLEAVTELPDGNFELSVRQGSATRPLSATHVVLALPLTLLRDVRLDVALPPPTADAIRHLPYGTNAKLMIGFSGRPWRERHRSNGSVFSNLPFQTAWEASRLQPGAAGVLVNFVGGRHGAAIGAGSARNQAAAAVADLERIFPGVQALRAGQQEARMHWPSNPWVRGSYSCFGPGHFSRFGGAFAAPVRRLHFAGEHTSADFWGFMEGGCESGTRAARAIVADLGLAWDPSKRWFARRQAQS